MVIKIICLALTAFFCLLAVVYISGRGSTLVTRHYTANSEEKTKTDARKISRTIGVMNLGFAAATATFAFFRSILVFVVIFVGTIAVGLIYLGTGSNKS